MTTSTREKPVVAHSVSSWLPLTMTWVYNQLRYMERYSPIVLANTIQNIDHFPWNPIYSPNNIYVLFNRKILNRMAIKPSPSIYKKAIEKHKPSILHSHFGDRGWYDLKLAKRYDLKHFVTFYGHDVNRLPTQKPIWKQRYRELFKQADLFLCEGPYMADCIARLGCPTEKIQVQPLGVEVEKIGYQPRKWYKNEPLRVLIVGVFREKKGIPYALEAIGRLIQMGRDVRVTLIGDSTGLQREEDEKRKIYGIIEKYHFRDKVAMLGFKPHEVLLDEAYKHHIFCSPSVTAADGDTEGGAPVTIIEMAASGMPIISTTHADIPYVLSGANRKYLAEEASVDKLVQIYSLALADDNWDMLTQENRRHIMNQHGIKETVSNLELLYGQFTE